MIPSIAASFGAKSGIVPGATQSVSTASHSLTLTDTSGSGSTGFFRQGVAFAKGDVPSGRILAGAIGGTPIRLAMMETNTWSDGSLRKATVVGDAGSIGSGASVRVDITSEVGTQAASGVNPFTYLGTQDDLTVEIRSHTGSADNINVGDLNFSIQTAIATATRREIQGDNPVCVRAYAWQQVGNDQHLICNHYVDLWLDSGSVVGVEWTPVITQPWLVNDPFGTAQTKQLRNYDAEAKDGTTSLVTHTGLGHAYHCSWAALRTDDDDQHAKRLWLDKGSAMPTLNVQYSTASRHKMMRAGYVPPLRLDEVYSATNTAAGNNTVQEDYVPLGSGAAFSLNQKALAISGPGGYPARGLFGHFTAAAISEQTAQRWREARIAAQAGLAINHNYRDHRSDGTDTTNKLIPPKFAQLGAQSYTGLAAEANYNRNTGGSDIAIDQPTGGAGNFTEWDASHNHDYCYEMAFFEGERYLLDALLSQGVYTAHDFHNLAANNPHVIWENGRRTSLPDTLYGTIYLQHIQERAMAWSVLAMDNAQALCPDADAHKPLLNKYQEAADDWLVDSIANFGASQLAAGIVYVRSPAEAKTFMGSFNVQAFSRNKILHENALTGHGQALDIFVTQTAGTIRYGPYALGEDFRLAAVPGGAPEWNSWYSVADGDVFMAVGGDCSSSVITISHALGLHATNGDRVVFYEDTITGGLSTNDPPAELTLGQEYFVVNASQPTTTSTSFQVSTTSGGAAVTLSDVSNFPMGIDKSLYRNTTVVGDGTTLFYPNNDETFASIASAAVEMAWLAEVPGMTAADITKWRTFFQPRIDAGFSIHGSWNLDAAQVRPIA